MNSRVDTTDATGQQPDLWDQLNYMETVLLRARNLTKVLWMAGESFPDMGKRNAITSQCDVINELLGEALDIRAEVASAVHGRTTA